MVLLNHRTLQSSACAEEKKKKVAQIQTCTSKTVKTNQTVFQEEKTKAKDI